MLPEVSTGLGPLREHATGGQARPTGAATGCDRWGCDQWTGTLKRCNSTVPVHVVHVVFELREAGPIRCTPPRWIPPPSAPLAAAPSGWQFWTGTLKGGNSAVPVHIVFCLAWELTRRFKNCSRTAFPTSRRRSGGRGGIRDTLPAPFKIRTEMTEICG